MSHVPPEICRKLYSIIPHLWEAGRDAGYVTREQIREALRVGDNCRKLKPHTLTDIAAALECNGVPVLDFPPNTRRMEFN